MTWRAFLLGLVLVVVLSWADVAGGMSRGYGWTTEGHFPYGCVFLLVVVTLALNVLIKLVKKTAAFRQAELMLIWCMLIVGATVPATGLMRFWFPMLAAPPYLAQRHDIVWRDTALDAVSDTLVLSKDPKSVAVKDFFEGGRTEGRMPWRQWLTPISRWALFFAAFYLAVIFLCGILRKQWVDKERLQFPLACVPLEFTEGSAGGGLLPSIFGNRAFVVGLLGALAFRLIRAVPVLFGKPSWAISMPLADILQGTSLEKLHMVNFTLNWMTIGFAYLVPVDVSLSIWFFYLFGRAQLLTAAWLGLPVYTGRWSPLIPWQQAGAYVAFTVGALYMCRHHLRDVFRKALGRGAGTDDSEEPISYRVSFWGFLVCSALCVVWFVAYDMRPVAAVVLLMVFLSIQIVHARLVAQSGVPNNWLMWDPADLLYGASGGHIFGSAGPVLAHMQRRMMMHEIRLCPAVIHCLRISKVFKKSRRLLVPALLVALVVALTVSSWTFLDEAYDRGTLNFNIRWAAIKNPLDAYNLAHQKIQRSGSGNFSWSAFGTGVVVTTGIMIMRSRFYWWPIHPIGIMANAGWHPDRMWLPFLLGWLIKVCISKFGGGRMLRDGRHFFMGLIMAEASLMGISATMTMLSGGLIPRF